jgi:hypothetical protein
MYSVMHIDPEERERHRPIWPETEFSFPHRKKKHV